MLDETEKRKLDIKKRKFRRNAAITSFVFLIFISFFYMIGSLYMSLDQANILEQFNAIIITQCAVFASIILGHLGFDYLAKI
jgi:uncharacterized membrane protein affecting hemolysin expression